jgi:hypothetical protein
MPCRTATPRPTAAVADGAPDREQWGDHEAPSRHTVSAVRLGIEINSRQVKREGRGEKQCGISVNVMPARTVNVREVSTGKPVINPAR